jgi:branched-chain amino acid aminotransferase
MVNNNGILVLEEDASLDLSNRGFNYGDAVFETVKISDGKISFWEDHYFRLMASMRIMRMEIPMNYTLEFFEHEIQRLQAYSKLTQSSARLKIVVFRESDGYYKPEGHNVKFVMHIKAITNALYTINTEKYVVDLYKDNYVSPSLLSTLKTNNKALNILASIYASENKLNNCLLINTNKQVIEAANSNLFLVKGNTITTPPLSNGCLRGVMRKQLIKVIRELPDYQIQEEAISPFELQKADELFLSNVIFGIQPITQYRKKTYQTLVSQKLLGILNLMIREGQLKAGFSGAFDQIL